MKRAFLSIGIIMMSCCLYAGAAGVLVKGVVKSWDEIAKVALKVSGKSVTDDAVKAAAKTIERAAAKYGDDVAVATMRGGVEVAEQSIKRGGKFVKVLKSAANYSDEAIKAVALHSDDAIAFTAKYGDDVLKLGSKAPGAFSRGIALIEKSGVSNVGNTLKVIVKEVPSEQLPQVFGAIEKNPSVAKQFLDGVGRGGKHFVDKIFALNAKQILSGTLGAAAIATAVRMTAPNAAEGDAIRTQTKAATTMIESGGSLNDNQREFVNDWSKTTSTTRKTNALSASMIGLVIAIFIGVSLLVYVIRKSRVNIIPKNNQTSGSAIEKKEEA